MRASFAGSRIRMFSLGYSHGWTCFRVVECAYFQRMDSSDPRIAFQRAIVLQAENRWRTEV